MKQKLPLLALLTSLNFSHAQEMKIDMHGKEANLQKAQIFYGKILEIKPAMGYKYLKIDEDGKTIWVAIANAPVKIGEKIGYDKKTVMKDFQSKSLNQKFEEIYFASDVYLAQEAKAFKSLKSMLAIDSKKKNPHAGMGQGMSPEPEEKPAKPFVKKDAYSIEEIHMWRKDLNNTIINLDASVFKVSHGIMKRDWVHLGDGSGNEKKLTDDLVFTTPSSTLKKGDKVIATGKVVLDRDFGYGYFYKVIIEDATFKIK